VFGGAWGLYPDQLDFRNYQFGNVYADTPPREIPSSRTPEGLTTLTVREENLEHSTRCSTLQPYATFADSQCMKPTRPLCTGMP